MDRGKRLGDLVIDRVTGLKGIATARIEHLSGAVELRVQPPSSEGGYIPPAIDIDYGRLELITKEADKV